MAKQSVARGAAVAIVGLIASVFLIVGTQTTLASSKRSMPRSAMCKGLVNPKGLKGDEQKAEFKKCMADPQNYK
jgi:hypothetical protein